MKVSINGKEMKEVILPELNLDFSKTFDYAEDIVKDEFSRMIENPLEYFLSMPGFDKDNKELVDMLSNASSTIIDNQETIKNILGIG